MGMHLNSHAVSRTSFKNVCSVESSHNFVTMQTFETDIKCLVVHVQCCPFNPVPRTIWSLPCTTGNTPAKAHSCHTDMNFSTINSESTPPALPENSVTHTALTVHSPVPTHFLPFRYSTIFTCRQLQRVFLQQIICAK